MFSQKKKTGFFKNEDCPSSYELLAFQTGDIDRSRRGELRQHMESCEFCEAEVEFYSHYPQAEGAMETAEIPAPLFELAEALLKHRNSGTVTLESLLKENGNLVADSV